MHPTYWTDQVSSINKGGKGGPCPKWHSEGDGRATGGGWGRPHSMRLSAHCSPFLPTCSPAHPPLSCLCTPLGMRVGNIVSRQADRRAVHWRISKGMTSGHRAAFLGPTLGFCQPPYAAGSRTDPALCSIWQVLSYLPSVFFFKAKRVLLFLTGLCSLILPLLNLF